MERGIESIIDFKAFENFAAKATSDEINDMLEQIFEDEAVRNEMIGLVCGKQLIYNKVVIKILKDLAEFFDSLGEGHESMIATYPTDSLLCIFRLTIDVIEKNIKAKDKELEGLK